MKRILLISYYFEPFNGVGAKRLSYWADSFFESNESTISCSVITATPQPMVRENIHYVAHTPHVILDKLIFGVSWVEPLKDFLNASPVEYNYVVISGGPFGHFIITDFIKKKYNCLVALDFRDPFSGNVRFGSSPVVEMIKRMFEKKVTRNADYIITVNKCCKDILERITRSDKIHVIENGYDERIVSTIESSPYNDGKIHIGHAGKFYVNPAPFLKSLIQFNASQREKTFVFHHIGKKDERLASLESETIIQYGEKHYKDVISILKRCSIGFLLTSGELLEYNTKVFDYIACDLDILVVTKGEPHQGCIDELLQRVSEKVFWTRDTEIEIMESLQHYETRWLPVAGKEKYSRRQGFMQLKQILNINHI